MTLTIKNYDNLAAILQRVVLKTDYKAINKSSKYRLSLELYTIMNLLFALMRVWANFHEIVIIFIWPSTR